MNFMESVSLKMDISSMRVCQLNLHSVHLLRRGVPPPVLICLLGVAKRTQPIGHTQPQGMAT